MAGVVANPYSGLSCDDRQRWVCVYPAYINSRKSASEGRQIPRQYTVDNPLCTEIRDVCVSQQLNAEIENNHYPKEPARDHIHTGRVRVQLRQADGSYVNTEITSRKDLLHKLGELIPKLKSRQSGGGRTGAAGGDGGQGSNTAAQSKKKKKGKKK